MTNDHLAQPLTYAGASLGDSELAALVVHGRGQDPEFMLEVLERVALPEIAYVLPRAAGNTWYPKGFMAPEEDNEPYLGDALETCGSVARRIQEYGYEPGRIALVAFSQGACLLSEFLVRHPRRYAAAALLTGGYIGPPGPARVASGDLAGMPVFLGSSRHDEWVPLSRAEETAALLRRMGADVTFDVYDDREHIVNDTAVQRTRDLLKAAAAGGS